MSDGEEDEMVSFEVPESALEDLTPPIEPEELEVRPEPPEPKPTAKQPPTAPLRMRSTTGGSGAEVLKAQLERSTGLVDSLTTANQRAQTELARQRQANAEMERSHVEDRRATLDQTARSVDAALDEAEATLSRAFESGIGADVAKAQRRLTELSTARLDIDRQLASLPSPEQMEARTKTATAPRTREEKVEAYISQFTPASQKWLRANQEFIENRAKNERLLATHKDAIAQGLEIDTDDYFNFLDEKLGTSPREALTGGRQEAQPVKRQTASVPLVRSAAPVRGGSGISVQTMRSVQLSKKEIDNATDGTIAWQYDDPSGKNRFKKGDPIGINEMVRRKALIKAGKTNLRYMTDEQ